MAEEQQQAPQMGFNIEKIYVKDLSVEVPNAPAVFLEREAPQIDVQLGSQSNAISQDVYENTVKVTVTAKVGDKTLFLVECVQAGIFRISGVPQEQLPLVLGIGCPNIVFPYLRETVSDVVIRAGFPPLLLNPFNYEAEFMRQQQNDAQGQGKGTTHGWMSRLGGFCGFWPLLSLHSRWILFPPHGPPFCTTPPLWPLKK